MLSSRIRSAPGGDRLVHLRERVALDLDRPARPPRLRARHRGGEVEVREVVVLDEHRVAQALAVVEPAARRAPRPSRSPADPGSVLRVSRTFARPAVASTYSWVAVATPEACCRRLSAVRSAPRIDRRLPGHRRRAADRARRSRRRRRATRARRVGSTWANTSVAAATPASTP